MTLKKIFSDKRVLLVLGILVVLLLLRKTIKKGIEKIRENKFDRDSTEDPNKLALNARSAVNPSGIGWMVDFDGTDEYVTFGTSDALITQDASVSTWIYTRANSGRVISHNWNFTYNEFGWAVHLGSSNWSQVTNQASATWMSSDNAANYNASACVQSNASSIPLNQWFNLTITKSGANVSIYLDNSLIKTGTVPSSIAYAGSASNKTLVIGTNIFDFYVDLFGDEFNGRIGSINIYNRALTSDEIARNYNATRHRFGV